MNLRNHYMEYLNQFLNSNIYLKISVVFIKRSFYNLKQIIRTKRFYLFIFRTTTFELKYSLCLMMYSNYVYHHIKYTDGDYWTSMSFTRIFFEDYQLENSVRFITKWLYMIFIVDWKCGNIHWAWHINSVLGKRGRRTGETYWCF